MNTKFIVGPIDAQSLQKFWDDLSDPESLRRQYNQEFIISSPGGEIGYMLSMFDQIRLTEGITIATGLLQSAAAVLLQAGKVRRMTRNSLLLFHEPEATETLPSGEKKIPDRAYTLHTHMAELVADRTGMSQIEAYDVFDGRFINPEKAKQLNLIDEIIELPVIPIYQPEVTDGRTD